VSLNPLGYRLVRERLGHMPDNAVKHRPQGRGHWNGAEPSSFARREIGVVKDDSFGRTGPPSGPCERQCQMALRGEKSRKFMDREHRFVTENPLAFGPKPDGYEVVTIRRRKMNEPKDSA